MLARRRAVGLVGVAAASVLYGPYSVSALHSVNFANNCGYGVPTLDRVPSDTIATGTGVVFQNTTIVNAVAFLNTGVCGPNGGNCTSLDVNLGLPDGTSSAVVDLIPTHEFSVPVSFSFYNACVGAGTSCLSEFCPNAIYNPSDTTGVVNCTAASDPTQSAGLLITWCPFGSSSSSGASSSSSSSSSFSSSASSPNPSSSSASAPASTSQGTSAAALASSAHTDVGAIAGGVVGGVAALVLLTLLTFFLRRRHKALKAHALLDSETRPTPYFAQPSGTAEALLSAAPTPSFRSSGKAPVPVVPVSSVPMSAPAPAPSATASSERPEPDLDRIVEGLAERFGWRAPPNMGSVDGDDGPGDALPAYDAVR